MDYEEAKKVVRKFFNGISQPVKTVTDALDMISEKDYYDIQKEKQKISTI